VLYGVIFCVSSFSQVSDECRLPVQRIVLEYKVRCVEVEESYCGLNITATFNLNTIKYSSHFESKNSQDMESISIWLHVLFYLMILYQMQRSYITE
jgi:hypothetical protein